MMQINYSQRVERLLEEVMRKRAREEVRLIRQLMKHPRLLQHYLRVLGDEELENIMRYGGLSREEKQRIMGLRRKKEQEEEKEKRTGTVRRRAYRVVGQRMK